MIYAKGLEGVIAGETAISNVEGEIGRLSYRGYDINQLVQLEYEQVVWLVLFGDLPSETDSKNLKLALARGQLSEREISILTSLGTKKHPMLVLQAMIPMLDFSQETHLGLDDEGSRGIEIIAKIPTIIATYRQVITGKPLPVFDPGVPYLENYFTMFNDRSPSAFELSVLKAVQILQLEHSFNAGTFTARVAASTLAPIESVLSAATGALYGKLHGGADEAALNDAKSVGEPGKAPAYIEQLIARKGKLMGMGHREYRKIDPRSQILQPLAKQLCQGTPQENTYLTLEALEAAFNKKMQEKGSEVWANLEFYKGPVYEALGIPANFFTATFTLSRSVGWLAHFIESRLDNRIIRPKAAYVGAALRDVSPA